jgi:hypothetical protein
MLIDIPRNPQRLGKSVAGCRDRQQAHSSARQGEGCSEKAGREHLLGRSARFRQAQSLPAGSKNGTRTEPLEIRSERRREIYR